MATVNEQKKKDMLTGYVGPTQATASQNTAPKTGTATQQTQAGNLQNLMSNFTTAAKQALQNQQQTKASQPSQYTGLQGVNGNTAQQLGNLQQGYQQGDAVSQAMANLQSIQDQKPQGYESKYGAQLDSLLNQIMNPQEFKYSFNGDELFKQYADLYTQQGKQAAMDAMGQAAALTGGYGNSWAENAANQANQQWLLGLYAKGMDLRDRAFDQYKYGQQQLADQYNMLQAAEGQDYDRYLDQYNQWLNERSYATGRADTEYDRDYGQYANDLNYWTQMAQAENSDYWQQQQMAENKRQWDMTYEYNKMTDDRKYAYNICTAILANGKMPSPQQLKAAGISEADAKKMKAQATSGRGGGVGSGKGGDEYYEMNGRYYKIDETGKPVQVKFSDIPQNGRIYTGQIAQDTITTATKDYTEKKAKETAETAQGVVDKVKNILGIGTK